MKIRWIGAAASPLLIALACSAELDGDPENASAAIVSGSAEATIDAGNNWGSGYCANVTIANKGTAPITGWTVGLNLNGATVYNSWNGTFSASTVTPVGHNAQIQPGQSTGFGFCANKASSAAVADIATLSVVGSSSGSGGTVGGGTTTGGTTSTGGTTARTGGSGGATTGGTTGTGGAAGGATNSSCTPRTYEAENVTKSTGGGDGPGWNVWSNGYVSVSHSFSAGANTISVVARGTVADNGWPNMRVSVGGREIGQKTVGSTSYQTYDFPFTASAGAQEIRVEFTNDYNLNGQDRNLIVDKFTVACGGSGSSGSGGGGGSGNTGNSGGSGNTGNSGGSGNTGGSSGGSGLGPFTGTCSGWASRYWDCCKPHCGWSGNAPSGNPVTTCGISNSPVGDGEGSACSGGGGFMCHSMAPWKVNDNLSYGYAATPNASGVCGRCYRLQFSGSSHNNPSDPGSRAIGGKEMIIQVTNIGGDVGSGQFDLLIPGGGVGQFNACARQLGTSDLGQQYGGFRSQCGNESLTAVKDCVKRKCDTVFANFPDLKAGCNWYVEFLQAADNPSFKYDEIACPAALTDRSTMPGVMAPNACY